MSERPTNVKEGGTGFDTIESLIADLQQGKMILLLDDEDRENEGDLVMAAEKVRPEDINFMVKYGRGLVCMPMTQARCQQLGIPLMVPGQVQSTHFTVSIEAREGVSTGISAEDRAKTVRAAVAKHAKPSDLVQPGHIFPIMAQPGGVLRRAGHTEASTDLVRMAGMEPAAVIVEVLNDDGTMARRDDLAQMAKQHGLKIGTIADLIRYRIQHERTIECVATFELDTRFGLFQVQAMLDMLDQEVHFVLTKGQISPEAVLPVRVHYQEDVGDTFAVKGMEKVWSLHRAMEFIQAQEAGVIVYLSHRSSSHELMERLQRHRRSEAVRSKSLDWDHSMRTVGTGARILQYLGVKKMQLLSAPKHFHALSAFGLEIVEYCHPPLHDDMG
jgi:3,4-dihydroxy 2-butanone 4-phosphate synthase / GTP cyclohydrolase II